MRKYPPGTLITRRSVSEYTFKNTNVTIPKGTMIWIPAFPIHRDPNIYPNPDDFNPENFTEDAINNRHPMNYLAFSNGPRNCIGKFLHSIFNSNLLYIRFKKKKEKNLY